MNSKQIEAQIRKYEGNFPNWAIFAPNITARMQLEAALQLALMRETQEHQIKNGTTRTKQWLMKKQK